MKRWKVDVNGRQDAMLLLSSVSLPGGVQVSVDVMWSLFCIYIQLNSLIIFYYYVYIETEN